jgi:hypothetical protein
MRRCRSMAAACAFDGRCVVAGGFDNDHATTPAVESHEPLSDKWCVFVSVVAYTFTFFLVDIYYATTPRC